MICVRAALACGTTPGMLRNAWPAPGMFGQLHGRPGLAQPIGVHASVVGHRVEGRHHHERRGQSAQVVGVQR